MAFFRSLFLATALMVFAGSATFAQNMSMDFGNKGGLGFFDPMLCSEDFFEAFRLAGKNPPDPIPEMCAQYSMGHKLMEFAWLWNGVCDANVECHNGFYLCCLHRL